MGAPGAEEIAPRLFQLADVGPAGPTPSVKGSHQSANVANRLKTVNVVDWICFRPAALHSSAR